MSRRLTPHKLLSPNTLSVELSCEDETVSSPRLCSPISPVRGISYPPLSPKCLKRGVAIQHQSSLSARDRSETTSPLVLQTPNITIIPDQADVEKTEKVKRGGRFERPVDSRRYHTAGTIEDLKVCDAWVD